MPPIKNKVLKKIICLGLSAVLIYNTTVPAFGQEYFLYEKHPIALDYPEIAVDKTYVDRQAAEIKANLIQIAMEERDKRKEDATHKRAMEIVNEILGTSHDDLYLQTSSPNEDNTPPKTDEELKTEYLEGLQEEANKAKGEIQTRYQELLRELKEEEAKYLAEGNFSEEEIANWKAENLKNLKKTYKEATTKVDDYFKEEIDQVNNNFEEFLKELKEEANEAFFEHVKKLFNELMGLYKLEPNKTEGYILTLMEVITTFVNNKKQHLYTKKQRQTLINMCRNVIKRENASVGKDNKRTTNVCETRGHCPELLSAILGLSALTSEDERYADAQMVFNTIENYKDTAANFAILLNGISGLLVMKEYELVRKILKAHTEEETDTSFWDYLSFMDIAIHIGNTNGKYLGNLSKSAEYWSDGVYRNVYSDLAQMLAEEGSEGSLRLLREFGVERCRVTTTHGVQKETLSKYSISCYGIMPFLAGALLSGKSGADKYSLSSMKIPQGATQYMDSSGRIYNYPKGGPDNSRVNYLESSYYSLVNNIFSGDAEAMLALHVMSLGMGDLNPQQERSLDTELYNTFKYRIPTQFLKSRYIVVDDDRFSKKEDRNLTRSIFIGVGMLADVYVAVKCIVGIGLKAATFGKGLVNAFKLAKVGATLKNIPALAKVAAAYTKNVFMQQKIVTKIANMGQKFKKFSTEYKSSVRLNVLSNAAHYTNAVHDYEAASMALAPARSNNITRGLMRSVRKITYSEELGVFVLGEGTHVAPQVTREVKDIVDTATVHAKSRYRVAKMFNKEVKFKDFFLEEVNNLVAASPLGVEDKQVLIEFFKGADFEVALGEAEAHISSLTRGVARNFAEHPLTLSVYEEIGNQKGKQLGVDFVIGEKIPAFSKNVPQYATLAEEDGRFVLKFFKNESEVIDLSAFKLSFESSDGFVDFARASAKLGDAGKIELKFIPKEANTFWNRNFRNVFARNKESLFGGRGTVAILNQDGKMMETGITLQTYKQYDGLRVIIDDNVGLIVRKGKDLVNVSTEGSFFLPKHQIRNFLNFAKLKGADAPWKIKLIGGMNKVNALYLQSMVSLSVASTGLVYPLSRNYPEMDMKELTFISLIAPYLLSAATPFVSPFVKKFGAIKMLKTSMYLSLGSLAIPVLSGFNGLGGIQADNPFSKPSPYLLYPSALLIGLATTLTRGSFSPLIQSIGGGSGTLKAVAFKSISSFMLVLPPMIGAVIDRINPKFFTNPDGSLYLNENGEPIQKHWFDFSFSYPVMLAVAGTALYKLQKVHFNQKIGRSPNAFTTTREFFKDVGSSYGLLIRRDLLPLTVSSALLAGAESSLLYTYSNSMASEYVRDRVRTEELVPVLALIGLNAPAFITRLNSKPILRAMGGDNILGYRNLLTASLALAGVGSYLLATQDDPLTFSLGLTLTSIGFANITSSILRYGHSKLAVELSAPKHVVTSWDVSYPTVFIGMSAVPYLYGYMNDRNINGLQTENKFDMVSLKNTSWQEVMGVPIVALALGGGLSHLGMRTKNTLKTINSGGLILPLGLVAEANNSGFRTLALPKPIFDKKMFNQNIPPQLNNSEPHFEYRPDLMVPSLRVTPNFSIEPVRQ